jgi:hypothetical protein
MSMTMKGCELAAEIGSAGGGLETHTSDFAHFTRSVDV